MTRARPDHGETPPAVEGPSEDTRRDQAEIRKKVEEALRGMVGEPIGGRYDDQEIEEMKARVRAAISGHVGLAYVDVEDLEISAEGAVTGRLIVYPGGKP